MFSRPVAIFTAITSAGNVTRAPRASTPVPQSGKPWCAVSASASEIPTTQPIVPHS